MKYMRISIATWAIRLFNKCSAAGHRADQDKISELPICIFATLQVLKKEYQMLPSHSSTRDN
jgi:hypothetical protein